MQAMVKDHSQDTREGATDVTEGAGETAASINKATAAEAETGRNEAVKAAEGRGEVNKAIT